MEQLQIVNESKIKYKSAVKRISQQEIDQINSIVEILGANNIVDIEYIATCVASAYKYICYCQHAYYHANHHNIHISDGYALNNRNCNRLRITVTTDEAIDRAKSLGFRLISRERKYLSR